MSESPPTFVIVGHITRDVVPGGHVVGGTPTYAGLMARNLGERVGVVTSASADFDFTSALPGIQIACVPAAETSTFDNRYVDGHRTQYVRAVAAPLEPGAIPTAWRTAEIALLAPLTNEVMPGAEAAFDGSLVASTAQGWLRRWDANGLVRHEGWGTVAERLANMQVVVLSEHDVNCDEGTIDMLRRRIPLLVVTRGAQGSTLFQDGGMTDFPPYPAREVDPTGAGDAFAAAFLIELDRSGDAAKACIFANCAASFVVEAPGAEGVPSVEQIAARIADGRRG